MSCEICMFLPYVWWIFAFWLTQAYDSDRSLFSPFYHNSTHYIRMPLSCQFIIIFCCSRIQSAVLPFDSGHSCPLQIPNLQLIQLYPYYLESPVPRFQQADNIIHAQVPSLNPQRIHNAHDNKTFVLFLIMILPIIRCSL